MSDDIINLNVGGTKLTTLRSTLCQVEDSLLATMFSDRWEDNIKRDKDGAVFFDFNPQHFILILDYLRVKKIATPQNPPPLPKVPEDQEESFNSLVQYLGLSKEITVPCKIARSSQSEKFSSCMHSDGITLEEGRKVAVCDKNVALNVFEYVLGENVYKWGTVTLKLKLESISSEIFIGITEGDVELLSQNINSLCKTKRNNSYQWPGSYGWVLMQRSKDDCKVRLWKDGLLWTAADHRPYYTVGRIPRQGVTLNLVLECEAGKVSLHLPIGYQFQIDIPKTRMWRLNVAFKSQKDTLRIVED